MTLEEIIRDLKHVVAEMQRRDMSSNIIARIHSLIHHLKEKT